MGLVINPFTGQLDITGSGGGGGSTPASRYTQTFNATTDWGAASGGFYTINILQAAHTRGANPVVQILETSGPDFILINVDLVTISSTGDVSFRVQDVPDLRFAGKIIIV